MIILISFPHMAAAQRDAQQNEQETRVEFQMVVPEGTIIPIILTAYLNSRSSQVGDTVYAETAYPIWIQQRLVIPRGSAIRGTVTDVVRPGKIKGKGRLAIRFDDILLPNGIQRDLIASFKSIHGPGDENMDRDSESVSSGGSGATDAGTIVGTTYQGAIIGALIDHGTGAAIGAGAGAAAGFATMLFTRGRDLVLSPGIQFDLELKKALKFAYAELEFTGAELSSAGRSVQPRPNPTSPRESNGRRLWPFGGIGIPIP